MNIQYLSFYKKVTEEVFTEMMKMSAGFAIQADRLHKKELGGGTVLDLGIYVIQLAQLVFGGEEPQQVASSCSAEND